MSKRVNPKVVKWLAGIVRDCEHEAFDLEMEVEFVRDVLERYRKTGVLERDLWLEAKRRGIIRKGR
jgi:hypothetical protein